MNDGNPSAHTPWVVRAALTAFPRAFREAHAAEMADDFAEARARCETRGERIRLAAATALDLIGAGLAERRAVRRQRRGAFHARDQMKGSGMIDHLSRDLRHAARALLRRPGFSLVAVVTLALGIGANTAMFSVVNAVLLKPLAWADPDGLVLVWAHGAQDPTERGSMSQPDVQDVATLDAVESMVGFRPMTATVTSGDEPEILQATRLTEGLMQTFRVRPALGRDLTPADDDAGSAPVLVIGYRYWQDRFGGRTDILGTSIQLAHVPYEIVGVAPPGFDFPDGAQLWLPWQLDTEGCGRSCHVMKAIGRVAGGKSLPELSAQLGNLAARLSSEHPATNTGKHFRAVRLAEDETADVSRGLWFILGAVSLVLLIACANVANLLLVRAESRRGEVALRTALGASRLQLASQVLMESAVLAAAGGLVGLGIARVALVLIRAMPAGTVPRAETIGLDASVLVFTLVVSILVTVLFGLGPALRQARGMTAADMIPGRRGGRGREAARSRSLLLAAEVALSVVLLAGAGLLLSSFDRLQRIDLGFNADQVTRFRVNLPEARYDSLPRIATFYETLEARLEALPGVVNAASAFGPPLGSGNITADVEVADRPASEPGLEPTASMHPVTPAYFATMGIPVLNGRAIEPGDRAGAVPVAVVDETFVAEHFPGEDPIGRRFSMSVDIGHGSPEWTVVGVVGSVRRSPAAAHAPAVYVPLAQFGPGALTVSVRTAGSAGPTISQLREVVRSIDPALPISGYETVAQALRAEVAPERFYATVMGVFAALALTLTCVGLYGVVAYAVSQRRPEIGIRIALGARRGQVVRMVLSQGLRPASVGLLIGLGLALAFGRVVESLLFDVSPRDPVVLATVVGLLSVVAFTAALVPAQRASAVDPVRALRE